jgi:Uma2 family endonuclease
MADNCHDAAQAGNGHRAARRRAALRRQSRTGGGRNHSGATEAMGKLHRIRATWHDRAMDPRPSSPMLLAPGAASYGLAAPARAPSPPPAIDDNFLDEGCGHEVVDGQVYELAPANEDHGTEHFHLPTVLGAALRPEYKGAVDLLTRPKAKSNHAPDVSIFPRARDEQTGGRRVEELIFEVLDTESLAHVTAKTRALIARGVRRAFLVDVTDRSIHEWSRDDDGWRRLDDAAAITDPCFVVPVPVRALLDELLGDDTVARSLLQKNNPVLAAALSAGFEHQLRRRLGRSLTDAEREGLLARLAAEGPEAVGDAVLDRTPEALAAWLDDAAR